MLVLLRPCLGWDIINCVSCGPEVGCLLGWGFFFNWFALVHIDYVYLILPTLSHPSYEDLHNAAGLATRIPTPIVTSRPVIIHWLRNGRFQFTWPTDDYILTRLVSVMVTGPAERQASEEIWNVPRRLMSCTTSCGHRVQGWHVLWLEGITIMHRGANRVVCTPAAILCTHAQI